MLEGCIIIQTTVLCNYKRKTRGSYGDDRLTRALDVVTTGDSVNKVSGRLVIESRS